MSHSTIEAAREALYQGDLTLEGMQQAAVLLQEASRADLANELDVEDIGQLEDMTGLLFKFAFGHHAQQSLRGSVKALDFPTALRALLGPIGG